MSDKSEDDGPVCSEPTCRMPATREGGKCEGCLKSRKGGRRANRDALRGV